ncbi:alpha-glucan family phosphorylase [Candidatus Woesearchaeota archaeon]|nr:alpha-glucan family phosphorylase [Candidatus Woesearchaeota archaeon]
MVNFADLSVAYFSMEIGMNPDIPTYSGGLGILAGDTLRSCADLKLPVVGVTLLYKKGYFKQELDADGNQVEHEMNWDPSAFLHPMPQQAEIMLEGRRVMIKAWVYNLMGSTGRIVPIIFLDTDLPGNSDYDRRITQYLYGFDEKYRLAQEIILGIGGVKMLESIGCCNIQKHHMNEGHSAILALELYKRYSQADEPIEEVRKRCVFTTHTPVPAGHDQFPRELAEHMLGENILPDIREELYINNKLNMTYLGLRFSKFINGVAKKHGEVSRNMFPGYHIESITNGVHSYYWICESFQKLFDKYLPGWEYDPFSLRYVLGIPKEEIWSAHQKAKQQLIGWVNKHYKADMKEEIFTIGFARRVATYKRGDLLFSDIKWLMKIAEKFKGIQIIYAGKAHPKDTAGKELLKRIISKMQEVSHKIKVCYVKNYDIATAKLLVSGVDLWLNTPQRPQEASGTSGMKAAHNGVLHFSVLDGWWLEGHIENITGWSIGAHPNDSKENVPEEDAEDMYTKLEYIIIPRFYEERDKWVEMMKHAIAINGSFFNTHRMVQQYVLNAYFK